MGQRWHTFLVAVLLVSLLTNVVVLTVFSFGKVADPVFGQAVGQGDGFIMATEQMNDQSPVCFVLDTRDPHLLVYKSDPQGQLYLTSAREIKCDLKVRDAHFPRVRAAGTQRTQPPVREVCEAVEKQKDKDEKDAKEGKDAKDAKDGKKDGKDGKDAKKG